MGSLMVGNYGEMRRRLEKTKTCGVGYNYKEVVWFSFDYGWKRRPTETTGLWVRGKFWFWGFPCSKFFVCICELL